jgi:maltose alpha-D-glucosyltransferase/alpha-amylase
MLNVMRFWLDLGLDGFRADAVPYLIEREGTNCENLPETHAYLKEVRRFIDVNYPGRILLAEANQWPQDLRPYFGDGDEFQMAFHFPVMPRIYMALRKANREPIVSILESTPPIPENCAWCTFLRNHDELTLEMVTEAERQWMWQEYAPEDRMRQNLGIRRRLAPLMDNDRGRIELAHALLFSLPGSPILYYGDEIAMGDNIWLEDRNGLRTPMQWNAGVNAGFSTAAEERLYSPVISEGEFAYTRVNVAVQRGDPKSWWHAAKKMLAVRKQNPVFGEGSTLILDAHNPAVLAILRFGAGETVLAVHNLSAERQPAHMDLSRWPCSSVEDLFTGSRYPQVDASHLELDLEGHGYTWVKLVAC